MATHDQIVDAMSIRDDDDARGRVILLDTNILIYLLAEDSAQHFAVKKSIEDANRKSQPFFGYTVATRLEVMEHLRGRSMSKWIVANAANDKGMAKTIGNAFWEATRKLYPRLSGPNESDHYVTDREFKQLRRAYLDDKAKGSLDPKEWTNLCGFFFGSALRKIDPTLESYSIRRVGLEDKTLFPEKISVTWDAHKNLMINYGMGSNDASILNMANAAGSRIYGLMTNDRDFAQVAMAGGLRDGLKIFTTDRWVLDNLRVLKVG